MKRIISLISVFLILFSIMPTVTFAATLVVDSGDCSGGGLGNKVAWTFYSDGTLAITGAGNMINWGRAVPRWTLPPWYEYRERIKTAIIEDGVTSIGGAAFYNCTNLTKVEIPNSVTEIGAGGSRGYTFYKCSSLAEITIPDGVTYISDYAFAETALTSVVIPDSVTAMGSMYGRNFYNCTALKSVTLSKNMSRVSKAAFSDCTSLTDVVIPEGIREIGTGAFVGCESIPGVILPDTVEKIGDSAFGRCKSLKEITVPNMLQQIGDNAFNSCTVLEKLEIPNSVTSIGHDAFTDTPFYGDESNWTDGIFYMDGWLMEADPLIEGECIVKEGTRGIADYAFEECGNINNIVIPGSMRYIGDESFNMCVNLRRLIIPNGVEYLGENLFYGNSDITVFLPMSLSSVDYDTFGNVIFGTPFKYCTLNEVYYAGEASDEENVIHLLSDENYVKAVKHYNTKWAVNSYAGGTVYINALDDVAEEKELTAYVAQYDNTGKNLIDCEQITFKTESGKSDYVIPTEKALNGNIRVMLWNSDVQPMCEDLEI